MAAEYRLILKYADEPGYSPDLECYLRHGGYEALKRALAIAPKSLPDGKQVGGAEQIRDMVKLSGLRGRGGGVDWECRSFVGLGKHGIGIGIHGTDCGVKDSQAGERYASTRGRERVESAD